MGEQGAESLHTRLHSLERNISGISNELDRLKHIFYMYNNIKNLSSAAEVMPQPKKEVI